jgi:hypothetical protein
MAQAGLVSLLGSDAIVVDRLNDLASLGMRLVLDQRFHLLGEPAALQKHRGQKRQRGKNDESHTNGGDFGADFHERGRQRSATV